MRPGGWPAARAANDADQAARTAKHAARLGKRIARLQASQDALIKELEAIGPGAPAADAMRDRIHARFAEVEADRTKARAELAALTAHQAPVVDPALLEPCRSCPPGSLTSRSAPGTSSTRRSASRSCTTTACTKSPAAPPSPPAHPVRLRPSLTRSSPGSSRARGGCLRKRVVVWVLPD